MSLILIVNNKENQENNMPKSNKTAKPPIINILGTTENPDGSLSVEFEYGQDWENVVKRDLNKKKITIKDVEKHFINMLKKAVDKKDGYDVEKLKD